MNLFTISFDLTKSDKAFETISYSLPRFTLSQIVTSFPSSILAGMFGFGEKQYFKAIQGSDVPPKVEF